MLQIYPLIDLTNVYKMAMNCCCCCHSRTSRWVLPPLPCLPSKFLLDVEAQRSPSSSLSAFIARHIEQPGSRHSKPDSINILSNPSDSACFLTIPDPGTTIASLMDELTFFPLMNFAASLKSSIREFVQEPIKTLSTLILDKGIFSSKSIYFKAL